MSTENVCDHPTFGFGDPRVDVGLDLAERIASDGPRQPRLERSVEDDQVAAHAGHAGLAEFHGLPGRTNAAAFPQVTVTR